jgi:hypothetical protein
VGYCPLSGEVAAEELAMVNGVTDPPRGLKKCNDCDAVGPPCHACQGTGEIHGATCNSCKGTSLEVHTQIIESCKG